MLVGKGLCATGLQEDSRGRAGHSDCVPRATGYKSMSRIQEILLLRSGFMNFRDLQTIPNVIALSPRGSQLWAGGCPGAPSKVADMQHKPFTHDGDGQPRELGSHR